MNKKLYRSIMIVFIIGLLICAFFIIKYLKESKDSRNSFEELTETAEIDEDDRDLDALPYNPDMIGWIRVDGTPIDYPVMQTKEEPEYYLHRDYYGQYSSHGVPFADAMCEINPPSDNIMIYGHHMRDGTMFASLVKFTDKSFYDSHSIIKFNTVYSKEAAQYRIIAVFTSQVNLGTADEYPFYSYIDLNTQEEFDIFYTDIKARSLYETGVAAQLGDKFITLATCEYSQNSSRMVIIGVKTEE